MFGVLGGLVLLLAVAIYSAVLIGKKTDQRITKLLIEEPDDGPMLVRFPEDVLRPSKRVTRVAARAGKQSI